MMTLIALSVAATSFQANTVPPVLIDPRQSYALADRAVLYTWRNVALLRADMLITNVLIPKYLDYGAGSEDRIRVVITFRDGFNRLIRFPPETRVACYGRDSFTLTYILHGRYQGIGAQAPPRGDGFPNYYSCQLRWDNEEFQIGAAPAVHPLRVIVPLNGQLFRPNQRVLVQFDSASFRSLFPFYLPNLRWPHIASARLVEQTSTGPVELARAESNTYMKPFDGDVLELQPEKAHPATRGASGLVFMNLEFGAGPNTNSQFGGLTIRSIAGQVQAIRW